MPTPRLSDALSGLFENPLFLLGANLAALSGKHRFPQALGGAALQTGGLMAELQTQAQREQAQKEESEIRRKYLGIAEEEAKAERQQREQQVQAYSRLQAALAGIEGDPLRRELILYQLSRGGGLSGLLPPSFETPRPLTSYQGFQKEAYEAEQKQKAEERQREAQALQDYETYLKNSGLPEDQIATLLFAARTGRGISLPKPKEDLTQALQDTKALMEEEKERTAGEAPSGGGILNALGGFVRSVLPGSSATPLAPQAPGATPLAPPARRAATPEEADVLTRMGLANVASVQDPTQALSQMLAMYRGSNFTPLIRKIAQFKDSPGQMKLITEALRLGGWADKDIALLIGQVGRTGGGQLLR
jgi:hypothetical protein